MWKWSWSRSTTMSTTLDLNFNSSRCRRDDLNVNVMINAVRIRWISSWPRCGQLVVMGPWPRASASELVMEMEPHSIRSELGGHGQGQNLWTLSVVDENEAARQHVVDWRRSIVVIIVIVLVAESQSDSVSGRGVGDHLRRHFEAGAVV